MRAQLQISHRDGEIVNVLKAAFGQHDQKALKASGFASKSPDTAKSITFAALTPEYLVMAWITAGQVRLYVESHKGQLRDAADQTWQGVRQHGKRLRPKLQSLVLFDEDSNDKVAEAGVGLAENAKRTEIVVPVAIGGITAAFLAVAVVGFGASWDLAVGSIPAFIAAILALMWFALDTRRGRLVWR